MYAILQVEHHCEEFQPACYRYRRPAVYSARDRAALLIESYTLAELCMVNFRTASRNTERCQKKPPAFQQRALCSCGELGYHYHSCGKNRAACVKTAEVYSGSNRSSSGVNSVPLYRVVACREVLVVYDGFYKSAGNVVNGDRNRFCTDNIEGNIGRCGERVGR